MTIITKKIRCLNNNTIYESIAAAAKELNIRDNGICHVLKGRQKTTKGYEFEYTNTEFNGNTVSKDSKIDSINRINSLKRQNAELKIQIEILKERIEQLISGSRATKIIKPLNYNGARYD